MVEVAGLRDVTDVSELINFALTLSRDRNFSGVLHWGQRNTSDPADIDWRFNDGRSARPGDLRRWRAALARTGAGSTAFSSAFTRQTGLEG